MAIEKGQYFTPDKKQSLINEVKSELTLVDNELRNNSLSQDTGDIMRDVRGKLQEVLNGLFDKKGVVTPQETDKILDILDDSKRNRLQKSFYKGMKTSTIVVVGFAVIAIGIYYYMKKTTK